MLLGEFNLEGIPPSRATAADWRPSISTRTASRTSARQGYRQGELAIEIKASSGSSLIRNDRMMKEAEANKAGAISAASIRLRPAIRLDAATPRPRRP